MNKRQRLKRNKLRLTRYLRDNFHINLQRKVVGPYRRFAKEHPVEFLREMQDNLEHVTSILDKSLVKAHMLLQPSPALRFLSQKHVIPEGVLQHGENHEETPETSAEAL